MECLQKKEEDRATTSFAAMFLVGLLTFSIIVAALVYMPTAMAKTTPVKIGNPNDFRPGPPIPSCNADFHQGPPNDPIAACRDSPAP